MTIRTRFPLVLAAALAVLLLAPGNAEAQLFGRQRTKMRKAGELIRRQEPAKIYRHIEPLITSGNSHVVISISKQRAWLMVGDETYIDTPVSTGKRAGMTPTGSFRITQKDPDHRSNIYGSFVDKQGRVVRDGVSMKVDSAPSGTRFLGAPMKWFMRLTDSGVGMHVGILPGYPASHGCIRLPADIAEIIYRNVKLGTRVAIEP
jgi:lipoprotein-anchoring transpeptidase ErfK/SrfK